MAYWLKCLLYTHKGWSSDLQNLSGLVSPSAISVLKDKGRGPLGVTWLARQTALVNSGFHRVPVSLNKVEETFKVIPDLNLGTWTYMDIHVQENLHA